MKTYIIDINYYFSKPLYTIRWKYISKVGRYFPTTFYKIQYSKNIGA